MPRPSAPSPSLLLCLLAATLTGNAAAAQSGSIEGTIRKYECGDNCYLTVVDGSGKAHTGLCTARECRKWNEKAEMPRQFVGRRVVVTVGRGTQFDGSGNVMGQTMSFSKIRFVK